MIQDHVVSPRKPNETGHSVPNSQHRKHIGSTKALRWVLDVMACGMALGGVAVVVKETLALVW